MFTDLNEVFQAAMAYVILSRVTGIEQVFIRPGFKQDKIYCSTLAKAEAQKLRTRAINLQKTVWDQETRGDSVIRLTSINARSLNQHYQDLAKDQFILNSDIVCIQVGRGSTSHFHIFLVDKY